MEVKENKKQSLFKRIKDTFVYALLAEVPPCGGYSSLTDCGYEYDCKYDAEIDCSECVCVDYWKGKDPRTGNKFKKFRRYFS